MDVKGMDGKPLSKHSKPQINAIKNLHNGDFMQILDENGTQKMAVDAHFEKSSHLTKSMRNELFKDDYIKRAKENLKKMNKANK